MQERVVIIGGGIMGAAAAYWLARAGHPVTVLEKGELACGASGANLGQLSLIDREEPWHMQAALESLDLFARMNPRVNLEYEPSGGVVMLNNEEEHAAARAAAARLAERGVETEFLYGAEMHRAEPALCLERVHSLLYCPGEGKINPLNATLAFFSLAEEQGAVLRLNTAVTGFETRAGRVRRVKTTQGEFEADVVVNAAGAWAGHVAGLLGLSLPIDYHRAAAFVSQPVPKRINGPVVSGAMFLKRASMHMKRHIGTGCIQTLHGSIIIAQATEDAPVDSRAVTLPGLCLVAKQFLEYFPGLGDLEIVRAWACVTPFTPDGLPVFGFSREMTNFFTVAGFKGAFSTAPAVARHLTEALDEGIVWEDGSFSPDRTIERSVSQSCSV